MDLWNDQARVKTWASINRTDTLLNLAFNTALGSSVFTDLYIPVKTPTSQGMPDEYTYESLGVTTEQISHFYETYYGLNFLSIPLKQHWESGDSEYSTSLNMLTRSIGDVYRFNLIKYKKMIEAAGFTWNPLWNVDGTEKYTSLENSGTNDISNTKAYGSHVDSRSDSNSKTGTENIAGTKNENHDDTNSATTFDSTTDFVTDKNAGNNNTTTDDYTTTYNTTDAVSGTTTYGSKTDTDETTVTHHNAKNGEADYSGGVDGFGNTVVGGDKYHTDIKERTGNIGVTKTTELLNDALEYYRFNILQEFFNDLNKVILVGIY